MAPLRIDCTAIVASCYCVVSFAPESLSHCIDKGCYKFLLILLPTLGIGFNERIGRLVASLPLVWRWKVPSMLLMNTAYVCPISVSCEKCYRSSQIFLLSYEYKLRIQITKAARGTVCRFASTCPWAVSRRKQAPPVCFHSSCCSKSPVLSCLTLSGCHKIFWPDETCTDTCHSYGLLKSCCRQVWYVCSQIPQ